MFNILRAVRCASEKSTNISGQLVSKWCKVVCFRARPSHADPKRQYGDVPNNDGAGPVWSTSLERADRASIPNEELVMLTDEEESLPLIEAILNSPLHYDGWKDMPNKEKSLLRKLQQTFDPKRLPSVSKILAGTKSPLNELILSQWQKKKIKELGEVGFKDHMTGLRNQGHTFHTAVQNYLTGEPVDEKMTGTDLWNSVLPVLKKVEKVHSIEVDVFHPLLCYAGRFDCICVYKNSLCVFDWKSSQKRKNTLDKCYDDPYQLAAYAGAFNISNDSSSQITSAAVVKAYPDGTPADVHHLNEFTLDFFWNGWLRRLAKHHVTAYNSRII